MKRIAIFTMAFLLLLASSGHAAVVGEWHLDGNANDTSGNGNNGTEAGDATYTTGGGGVCGEALSLDGVGDGVSVADSASLDLTAAITIEGWVYPDGFSGYQTVAEKRYAYHLNIYNGHIEFYWYDLSIPGYHISPNLLPTGTWTHVAATYDGSNVILYENGVPVYSFPVTGTGRMTDHPVGIGYLDYGGGVRFFDGLIDEVRIHDTALTALEIAASAVPCAAIEKTKLTGPDEIGICLPDETGYTFEINYSGPDALVMDTVPAEFQFISFFVTAGVVDVFPANKKGNNKSATIITWLVPEGSSTLTVTIQTRQSPGKGHGKKGMVVYKPTSCGTLNLNDGAMAYQVDEDGPILDPDTGEMIPIEGLEDGSEPLEVEAVCGAKPCAPENLTVTLVGEDTLSLDWDDVCVGGDPVVYNVYRDGELIAEDLEDSDYDDTGLAPGLYCYEVEAEYVSAGPGYESGKSEEVCETVPTP